MTELIVRASAKSAASKHTATQFPAVYRSELVRLVRLAHLITGSNTAAEDLVHDAFIAAFQRWDRIRDPQGYLYRAVVNRCRSYQRRRRLELAFGHEDPRVVPPPEVDEMWTALERIPARRRTALVLRYYADLPISEIAELMGTRAGTVRSLIHRGHESLRKELEQ